MSTRTEGVELARQLVRVKARMSAEDRLELARVLGGVLAGRPSTMKRARALLDRNLGRNHVES